MDNKVFEKLVGIYIEPVLDPALVAHLDSPPLHPFSVVPPSCGLEMPAYRQLCSASRCGYLSKSCCISGSMVHDIRDDVLRAHGSSVGT